MSTFPAALQLPLVRVEDWKSLTYLGARARVLVEHHDRKRSGLRTITTEWVDDADARNGGWPAGSVTRRTVRGDGRTADFEVVVPEALVS